MRDVTSESVRYVSVEDYNVQVDYSEIKEDKN